MHLLNLTESELWTADRTGVGLFCTCTVCSVHDIAQSDTVWAVTVTVWLRQREKQHVMNRKWLSEDAALILSRSRLVVLCCPLGNAGAVVLSLVMGDRHWAYCWACWWPSAKGHSCFNATTLLNAQWAEINQLDGSLCAELHTHTHVLHMPKVFTFAFFPQSFLLTLLSFPLPPCSSDATLQPPQPPSCSPKRRSLVSRSPLPPTLSIAYIQTLTSRSRSLSGCRGNGNRSSKTRPKGPNPSSMWLSSLL